MGLLILYVVFGAVFLGMLIESNKQEGIELSLGLEIFLTIVWPLSLLVGLGMLLIRKKE